ncbi:MAG: hypothetical protein F2705_03975 [Actinobacteria bacterium]|nr:hypothetical protein [Actinomycetota bacterium]
MPDPTFTSSQGFASYGVTGATKVSVKATRKSDVTPQLDASTLSIAAGGSRVYESGLTDYGQAGGTGVVVTVTIEGLGATKPTKGTTITAEGLVCKCMDSTGDDSVGELKKWSASYTSDYAS